MAEARFLVVVSDGTVYGTWDEPEGAGDFARERPGSMMLAVWETSGEAEIAGTCFPIETAEEGGK